MSGNTSLVCRQLPPRSNERTPLIADMLHSGNVFMDGSVIPVAIALMTSPGMPVRFENYALMTRSD